MISEDDLMELQDEDRNEDYNDWLIDHLSGLQMDWIDSLPPEDVPLDDDLPDFFDDRADDFDAFCRKRYEVER